MNMKCLNCGNDMNECLIGHSETRWLCRNCDHITEIKDSIQGEQKMKIGLYLKRLRVEQRLTLRELEAKSGVSFTQIARLENGESDPLLNTVEKLAGALGKTTAELIQEADDFEPFWKQSEDGGLCFVDADHNLVNIGLSDDNLLFYGGSGFGAKDIVISFFPIDPNMAAELIPLLQYYKTNGKLPPPDFLIPNKKHD